MYGIGEMLARVEAVVFSIFSREFAELSLFYLKLLLLKFVLLSLCFNLFYNIKGKFIGDIFSIIAILVNS